MYITSKFLAMILNLKKRIVGSGDIRIVVNNKFIKKLFKITMLDNIFEIHENVEDAINSF
jgi:anti-anti-sigma regulatory factor